MKNISMLILKKKRRKSHCQCIMMARWIITKTNWCRLKLKEKTMNDINDLYDVIQSGLALAGLSIVDFDKDGMIVRDKIKDNDYRIKITEEVN
nr:MAG TPA: hypothetical protein [Siphoviridae sp. ctHdl3]